MNRRNTAKSSINTESTKEASKPGRWGSQTGFSEKAHFSREEKTAWLLKTVMRPEHISSGPDPGQGKLISQNLSRHCLTHLLTHLSDSTLMLLRSGQTLEIRRNSLQWVEGSRAHGAVWQMDDLLLCFGRGSHSDGVAHAVGNDVEILNVRDADAVHALLGEEIFTVSLVVDFGITLASVEIGQEIPYRVLGNHLDWTKQTKRHMLTIGEVNSTLRHLLPT